MKRFTTWLAAMLVLCFAPGVIRAAQDPADGTKDDPGIEMRPGLKRVDGRVKEIDLTLRKIAVEVETEAGKPPVVMIFLLTDETKVREREDAHTLKDVHNGSRVLVFYTPPEKKDVIPTALFIRILDAPSGLRPRAR